MGSSIKRDTKIYITNPKSGNEMYIRKIYIYIFVISICTLCSDKCFSINFPLLNLFANYALPTAFFVNPHAFIHPEKMETTKSKNHYFLEIVLLRNMIFILNPNPISLSF